MADNPETRASRSFGSRTAADQKAWSEFVEFYRPVVYRPGGSPPPVDVRGDIEIRADEIANGDPRINPGATSWTWLWLLAPLAEGGFLNWFWQNQHRVPRRFFVQNSQP